MIESPRPVRDAPAQYGDLLANECQRRHCAEDLTGLLVAERETVPGIRDEFAPATDPSRLNRYRTEAEWDVPALNERRSEPLQKDPSTPSGDRGVIASGHTPIDRDGQLIPDAGWYRDHAEQRHKIARDYLLINYVCTGGEHYPPEFRLFRKEEVCRALKEPVRNHTELCREPIDWVCQRQVPGDSARDRYSTSAEVLDPIRAPTDRFGRPRGYVGDLKADRKPEWKGRLLRASESAASIPPEDRRELRIGDRRRWFITATVRIPGVDHGVRIVIAWRDRHDPEPIEIPVTDRITREVSRIVRVYRHRGTGAEAFHRDGKRHVGPGDCQLRDLRGRTRHVYPVMRAYSLLMSHLRPGCAKGWAPHRLMTIGAACRAMFKEALRTTLSRAIEQVARWQQPSDHVVAQSGLA